MNDIKITTVFAQHYNHYSVSIAPDGSGDWLVVWAKRIHEDELALEDTTLMVEAEMWDVFYAIKTGEFSPTRDDVIVKGEFERSFAGWETRHQNT